MEVMFVISLLDPEMKDSGFSVSAYSEINVGC